MDLTGNRIRVWAESMFFGGWALENIIINLWFHKRQRISSPTDQILAFQDGLCCME
jgi:hypothetical protein